ncbi:hypothetical protein [Streptomyces nojiriensis]|uniref:hypothetical protein n=1 Tax=Streptomyces nojiriensis TaxID=66374 RepID=UPI0035DCB9D3
MGASSAASRKCADGRNDAIGGHDRAAYEFHVSHVLAELGVHATRERRLGHIEAACTIRETFLDDCAAPR